jgi:pimeloyl-ACP methyl ester carboxylesterase
LSSIVTSEGIVHYEAYGRGKPIILLHGWLESWRLWRETMEALAWQYRSYALDFWGFGESGKARDSFTVSDFVALVDHFMESMGIQQAPVIGHSMGGTVGLSLALEKPSRVESLVMVGSSVVGSSLNPILRLAGRRPIAFLVWHSPLLVRLGLGLFSHRMVRDGWRRWYQVITHDLSQTTLESFLQSISSLARTDLRPYVQDLKVPTLVVFGKDDNIVSPSQASIMKRNASNVHSVIMYDSKHFPMLDEPESFNAILMDFLSNGRSNTVFQ